MLRLIRLSFIRLGDIPPVGGTVDEDALTMGGVTLTMGGQDLTLEDP